VAPGHPGLRQDRSPWALRGGWTVSSKVLASLGFSPGTHQGRADAGRFGLSGGPSK
jgi:hypothetical protein